MGGGGPAAQGGKIFLGQVKINNWIHYFYSQVDSEETWLPASIPEERSFTCMCWSVLLFYFHLHLFLVGNIERISSSPNVRHVDWDGLITVSTMAQQEGLRSVYHVVEASAPIFFDRVISTVLEAKFRDSEPSLRDLQG